MKKDSVKRNLLAVVVALTELGRSVTREQVQLLRKEKKITLDEALAHLVASNEPPDARLGIKDQARRYSREIGKMTDDAIRRRWPEAMALVQRIAPDASFSGAGKANKGRPDRASILAELNAARSMNGKSNLAEWRGPTYKLAVILTREMRERFDVIKAKLDAMSTPEYRVRGKRFEEEANKLARHLGIKTIVGRPTVKGETVVAEGAYSNEQEARMKTGHTTNGKSKTFEKNEARKTAEVKRRTTTPDAAPTKSAPATRKTVDTGEVTLADIARDLKLSPKAARAKARKSKTKIAALQVKGKKYVFARTNAKKVKELLA